MTRKYIDRRQLDALMMGTQPEGMDGARSERPELNLNLPAEKSPNIQENDWQIYRSGNTSDHERQALSEAVDTGDLAYEPPSKSTFKDYLQVGEDDTDEVTENFLDGFEDRGTADENLEAETGFHSPRLFGQILDESLDSQNVDPVTRANSLGDLELRDDTPFASMKSSENSTGVPPVNSEWTTEDNREELLHQEVRSSGQDSSGEKHVSRVSHGNSEGTTEISSGRKAGRIIKLPSSLRSSSVGEPPTSQPEKVLGYKLRTARQTSDDGLRPALRKCKSFQGCVSQDLNNDTDNQGQPRSMGSTPIVMGSESSPLRSTKSNHRIVYLSSKSSRSLDSTPETDTRDNKSVFSRVKGLQKKPTVFDRIKFSEHDQNEVNDARGPVTTICTALVQPAGHDLVSSAGVVDGDVTKTKLERSSSLKIYINHSQNAFQGEEDIRIRELLNCSSPPSEQLNGQVPLLGDRIELTQSSTELNRSSLNDLFSQSMIRETSDRKGGYKQTFLHTQLKGTRQHVSAEMQVSPPLKSSLASNILQHKMSGSPRDTSRTLITRETLDKKLLMQHTSPNPVCTHSPLPRDIVGPLDLDPFGSHSYKSRHLDNGRNQGPMGRNRDREQVSRLRYLSGKSTGDGEFREDRDLMEIYEGDRKKPKLGSRNASRKWSAHTSPLVVDGSLFNRDITEREYNTAPRNLASTVDLAQPSFLPVNNKEWKFTTVDELASRHPPYSSDPPVSLAPFPETRFCTENLQPATGRFRDKVEGGVPPIPGEPPGFWAQQETRERLRTPEVGNAAIQALKASEAAMRAEHIAMLAVEAAKEAKAKAEAAKSMALLEEYGEDPNAPARRWRDVGYEGIHPLLRTRGIPYF